MLELNRRNFIGSAICAGAAGTFAAPQSERIARIGLMTDTHVETTLESCSRVKAALELFKKWGAEMVMNCGDIADRHYPEGYRFYRQTVNTVYPDAAERPKEVFLYAYHDLIQHEKHTGGKWNPVAAFENVRKLLEVPHPPACDFVWKGLPFVICTQMTGTPGFPSWADYEKTVARVCEENPTGPVFVCDHVPPAGTTFHSHQWGNINCRRILNRFPRVVSLSGHVHGTLACERQVWQGEFTAVNMGCLQTWGGFAPGSTPPRQAKPNFGVVVMDVFRDRLVFHRLDVRDGSQFGPPWEVPLPFVAAAAPYVPATAAKRFKELPSFAEGVAPVVKPTGNPVDGYAIEIPESTVGPKAFMYRICCERRNAAGEWERFTLDDVFGEFWKAAKDRSGKVRHVLASGFFTPGETYRATVTPLDFYYRNGRAAAATEFKAEPTPQRTVWDRASMEGLRFTEYGKAVAPSSDGRFRPSSGQGTLWLPEEAFANLEGGKRHQFSFDLEGDQPCGDWCAWRVTLNARDGGRCLGTVQTVPGNPGLLRYVMAFKTPASGEFPKTMNLLFNHASPGSSLRVTNMRIIAG